MNTNVIDMLTAAVAAKKDSLKALRLRIAELLEPIPAGATLADEAGEVCRIRRICTGASQWSNTKWGVTIHGKGAIAGSKLLCEIDLDDSYCDGSNVFRRTSEPTVLYTSTEPHWSDEGLTYLSGPATRAIALRLPAAIERYMAHCAEEAAANAATLAEESN